MLTSKTSIYKYISDEQYEEVTIEDIVKTFNAKTDIKIMSFDKKSIVNMDVASTRSSDSRDFVCVRYTQSKSLISTPNQKIFDPKIKKYIRAVDINASNHVLTSQLDILPVVDKHLIQNNQSQSIYTVSTVDTGCYFAGGILIYNYS